MRLTIFLLLGLGLLAVIGTDQVPAELSAAEFTAETAPENGRREAGGKSLNYSAPGLKFSYPEIVAIEGALPALKLYRPGTSDFLLLFLYDRGTDFETIYKTQLDPEMVKQIYQGFHKVSEASDGPGKFQKSFDDMFMIYRSGDYAKFPGARELVVRLPSGANFSTCDWYILVPLKDRVFRIFLSVHEDRCGNLDNFWKPVIESLELDAEVLAGPRS